ncbi:probable CoA ligase CCL8 [Aristolochia californica]|uniref:probable CoA ligase CCL8 n=1 Tax=Aristolochia californica TaxID=171875 RepID=UPI0035E04708
MPKFSVRGIWQRWRESYPTDGGKVEDAITVFTGVPTMYTRLLQGYKTIDPDQQAHSASAACQLRLMIPTHGKGEQERVEEDAARVRTGA